jgi:hypothetical protein
MMSRFTRNVLLTLATIVALAISYYFGLALPSAERARLEFERMKYNNLKQEEIEKDLKAQHDAESGALRIRLCQAESTKAYDSEIKLNGQPVPGQSGVQDQITLARKIADHEKQQVFDACMAGY